MSNYFFFDFENIFDGNVSALEIKIDKALFSQFFLSQNRRCQQTISRKIQEKSDSVKANTLRYRFTMKNVYSSAFSFFGCDNSPISPNVSLSSTMWESDL